MQTILDKIPLYICNVAQKRVIIQSFSQLELLKDKILLE